MQHPWIRTIVAALAVTAAAAGAPAAADRFRLEVEAGAAWQTRNDIGIPGDTGTRFDLAEATSGPAFASRATFTWDVSARWSVRFLAAPLRLSTGFTPAYDVIFLNATFPAGQPVAADYRFDSYRVSGYYRFPSRGAWSFRLGATLKVRDAAIRLFNGATSQEKANTGLVPLLYAGIRWEPSTRFALDFETDAAAAPQGRAVDASLRGEFGPWREARPYVGYRILDGGADNDEVYNFATFQYALVGVSARF